MTMQSLNMSTVRSFHVSGHNLVHHFARVTRTVDARGIGRTHAREERIYARLDNCLSTAFPLVCWRPKNEGLIGNTAAGTKTLCPTTEREF